MGRRIDVRGVVCMLVVIRCDSTPDFAM